MTPPPARTIAAAGVLAGALALAAGVSLPEAWRHWRWWRPVRATGVTGPALVRIKVPLSMYGPSQAGLADVRLLDDEGREVPYALFTRAGHEKLTWRAASISDVGFVRDAHTEAIVEIDGTVEPHNRLEITTDRPDFFARAEVAASDDRATWRVLRDDAPLFRFEGGRPEDHLRIEYPESRARWLRLRVKLADEPFPIGGCRVAHEITDPPELEPREGRWAPVDEPGTTTWEIDLGWDGLPASTVRFATPAPEFQRRVRVQVRAGEEWREAGSGEIYRRRPPAEDSGAAAELERLQFSFPEAAGRIWRVVVENRNDPPVPDLAPTLLATPRWVVFRAEPGGEWRLVYGNHRTEAPHYDLASVTPREQLQAAPVVDVGPEEANDAWVSPDPWTERHPVVLWGALFVALAVLGSLAWRALR